MVYNMTFIDASAPIAAHAAVKQNIHGVGANDIADVADISTHAAVTTNVHGTGAGNVIVGDDELTVYEQTSNKNSANGYPGLDASSDVLIANLPKTYKKYEISSDVLHSHDGVDTAYSVTMNVRKTITLDTLSPSPVTIRVYFELKTTSGYTSYGRIYKNGATFGTLRSTTSTSYQTYSEDLEFNDGDTIELWAATTPADNYWFVRNFRVQGLSSDIPYQDAVTDGNVGVATPFAGTNS